MESRYRTYIEIKPTLHTSWINATVPSPTATSSGRTGKSSIGHVPEVRDR